MSSITMQKITVINFLPLLRRFRLERLAAIFAWGFLTIIPQQNAISAMRDEGDKKHICQMIPVKTVTEEADAGEGYLHSGTDRAFRARIATAIARFYASEVTAIKDAGASIPNKYNLDQNFLSSAPDGTIGCSFGFDVGYPIMDDDIKILNQSEQSNTPYHDRYFASHPESQRGYVGFSSYTISIRYSSIGELLKIYVKKINTNFAHKDEMTSTHANFLLQQHLAGYTVFEISEILK